MMPRSEKVEKNEGDYNPRSGECVSHELDSEITKLRNLSKPTVKALLRISISGRSKVSIAGNLYLRKRAPSYIWLMRTRFCFLSQNPPEQRGLTGLESVVWTLVMCCFAGEARFPPESQ